MSLCERRQSRNSKEMNRTERGKEGKPGRGLRRRACVRGCARPVTCVEEARTACVPCVVGIVHCTKHTGLTQPGLDHHSNGNSTPVAFFRFEGNFFWRMVGRIDQMVHIELSDYLLRSDVGIYRSKVYFTDVMEF